MEVFLELAVGSLETPTELNTRPKRQLDQLAEMCRGERLIPHRLGGCGDEQSQIDGGPKERKGYVPSCYLALQ